MKIFIGATCFRIPEEDDYLSVRTSPDCSFKNEINIPNDIIIKSSNNPLFEKELDMILDRIAYKIKNQIKLEVLKTIEDQKENPRNL